MNSSLLFNLLAVLIGVLSSQKFSLGGEVFVGEILCFIILLVNFKRISIKNGALNIVLLLLIWCLAQFISDVINQTEYMKAIKGILAPLFVIIIFLGLNTVFDKNTKYLPAFLLGVFLGLLLNKILFGNGFFVTNPWKWGLGSSLAYLFFTWLEFYNTKNKSLFLLCGCSLFLFVSLYFSARSLGAFMFIAGIIPVISHIITNTKSYQHISTSRFGFIELCCLLWIILFVADRMMFALFTYQPFLDLLPPTDVIKYTLQANSEWGPILGGRAEFLVSIQAFLDSPFFGHGSWAEDPYYVYSLLDALSASGNLLKDIDTAENNLQSFLIPTHSYLMGAMVYGGFAAGLFWFKVIGISISGFLNRNVISSPLLIYISIALIWNTLFSPFGADARWLSTVILWIYLFLLNNSKNSNSNQINHN